VDKGGRMRLGFDLDEVVVNLTDVLSEYIQNNYGLDWSPENFAQYNFKYCTFVEDEVLNKKIIDDMFLLANDSDFQTKCEPVVGAREVLQKLKRQGHKIFFISARPKQNQPQTFKWLRQQEIPFDGLKVIGHDKVKGYYGMKLMLDMFVDDLEKHLDSMWRFKKRWRKGLLLYTRPWNIKSIDGSRFTRVYDWQGILRHIGIQNR
jgi:uncharacterized HAD superfamily protein